MVGSEGDKEEENKEEGEEEGEEGEGGRGGEGGDSLMADVSHTAVPVTASFQAELRSLEGITGKLVLAGHIPYSTCTRW